MRGCQTFSAFFPQFLLNGDRGDVAAVGRGPSQTVEDESDHAGLLGSIVVVQFAVQRLDVRDEPVPVGEGGVCRLDVAARKHHVGGVVDDAPGTGAKIPESVGEGSRERRLGVDSEPGDSLVGVLRGTHPWALCERRYCLLTMPRDSFQAEMDSLREAVLDLGETVVDRLRTAVAALDEGDRERARVVLEGDHEINERYLQLESDCIDLFTLQQPVASDLRFIAASFKILTDLERVGDLAMNLGGYVTGMSQEFVPRADLVNIGELVADQLEAALAAYESSDPEQCHTVAERDDEIDGLCERAAEVFLRDLVDRTPDEETLETLLAEVFQLLLTVRDLERVGDHAVNIAARTLYMTESDDTLLY